jgi:hypothetical protein
MHGASGVLPFGCAVVFVLGLAVAASSTSPPPAVWHVVGPAAGQYEY